MHACAAAQRTCDYKSNQLCVSAVIKCEGAVGSWQAGAGAATSVAAAAWDPYRQR